MVVLVGGGSLVVVVWVVGVGGGGERERERVTIWSPRLQKYKNTPHLTEFLTELVSRDQIQSKTRTTGTLNVLIEAQGPLS